MEVNHIILDTNKKYIFELVGADNGSVSEFKDVLIKIGFKDKNIMVTNVEISDVTEING